MPPAYTAFLPDLKDSDAATAGGKGASLGELVHAGVPVPPAFVVTRAGFDAFMQAADPRGRVNAIVDKLDAGGLEASDAASQIRTLLEAAPAPEDVAAGVLAAHARLDSPRVSVRSSATCEDGGASAWAGQLHTFLDVSADEVVERVRQCWLSIFSPSALAYGAAHGYSGSAFAVAVVVQQMVDSEVSGIGFSVHPVTQQPDVMLIEACFGLGEAIVSGQIASDDFTVSRSTQTLLDHHVRRQKKGLYLEPGASEPSWRELGERGEEPKLSEAQALEYAGMLTRIADHYGHPVDTEWAVADGRFQVLQARPITTLAEEYREALIDTRTEWLTLVRRPMPLFETSIVTNWLDSEHAGAAFGIHLDRALSIQDEAGIANHFYPKAEMGQVLASIENLLRNDRQTLLERLHHGIALTREAPPKIAQGPSAFRNIEDASNFFVEVAQFTTSMPAMTMIVIEQTGIEDPEVRELAERLRGQTLYPSIDREIMDPFLDHYARALGVSIPERAADVITWTELREESIDRATVEDRLAQVREGRRFLFQIEPEGERVRFISQGGYLVARLAPPQEIATDDPTLLQGQAAWPGVHRGKARVVLAADAEGQQIDDGDVLVSIQSSPALMPLLRHAGAIVTDDGGIVCHAAIISRELKIPTVIGTATATHRIQTGDLLEVDAYAGTVRIVEKA